MSDSEGFGRAHLHSHPWLQLDSSSPPPPLAGLAGLEEKREKVRSGKDTGNKGSRFVSYIFMHTLVMFTASVFSHIVEYIEGRTRERKGGRVNRKGNISINFITMTVTLSSSFSPSLNVKKSCVFSGAVCSHFFSKTQWVTH